MVRCWTSRLNSRYMAQSKEHRHLLKHPVITSFLWYKWQRIRRYFNRNLRFFFLFVYLITWFIFHECGIIEEGESPANESGSLEWYAIFILFSVAMLFFIVKDWTNDIKAYQKNQNLENSAIQKENSCILLTKLILSNWVEAGYIILLVFVIIFGAKSLRYILAALLIILVLRELLQLCVSMKRYLTSFENILEITLIALVTTLIR